MLSHGWSEEGVAAAAAAVVAVARVWLERGQEKKNKANRIGTKIDPKGGRERSGGGSRGGRSRGVIMVSPGWGKKKEEPSPPAGWEKVTHEWSEKNVGVRGVSGSGDG